jgi:hypothetical protein
MRWLKIAERLVWEQLAEEKILQSLLIDIDKTHAVNRAGWRFWRSSGQYHNPMRQRNPIDGPNPRKPKTVSTSRLARGDHWLLLTPPPTQDLSPLAIFKSPLLSVAAKLLAVLLFPPLTGAAWPLAVLPSPPQTVEKSPLAVLTFSALTVAPKPLAVFCCPPLTAKLPLIVLSRPITNPPKREKLCHMPTTTLCEPVRTFSSNSPWRGSL